MYPGVAATCLRTNYNYNGRTDGMSKNNLLVFPKAMEREYRSKIDVQNSPLLPN